RGSRKRRGGGAFAPPPYAENGSPRRPVLTAWYKALGNPPANAGSSHQVANHREPSPVFSYPLDAANGKKFRPTLESKVTLSIIHKHLWRCQLELLRISRTRSER